MSKQAYITLVGRSAWAVINSYYFLIKEERISPDLIMVFSEELFKEKLDSIVEGLKIVNEGFDVEADITTEVVGNAQYVPAGIEVSQKVKELKEAGYTIALDVTPGRKALVAASLISAYKIGISHVFYLAVDRIEDIPVMMKPKGSLHYRDFMQEVGRER